MEILHKARDKYSNKWHEGWYRITTSYYNEECSPSFISVIQTKPITHNDFTEHVVEDSTVCVFTGLTDSKGVKIFEHDIISVQGQECEIVFNSGCFIRVDKSTGEKKFLRPNESVTVVGNKFNLFEGA